MPTPSSTAAPTATEPFALYVHWPWCLAKCPYCDFNSRAIDRDQLDDGPYLAAITAELQHYASKTSGRTLTSIFFGGGTPSLMAPDTAGHIIATASTLWGLHRDCEITLEANPTSIEAAKFRAFRDAGVNRVSVGVQALNDDDLHALGREHSAREARRAVDIAGAIFNRFTFDLIYARPGQGLAAWEDELTEALAIGSSHLSLYQLTVEPGTDFFRRRVAEAGEDLAADLYHLTQDLTTRAGLPAYEISNHARVGEESRHNLTYWTGHDYVGVGPGAHGRITTAPPNAQPNTTPRAAPHVSATHQIADPARWLDAVAQKGHGTAKTRALPAQERATELLLAGLRLPQGVDRAHFTAVTGMDLTDALDAQGLAHLIDAGLVTLTARALSVSPAGRLTLNAILQHLLA